MGLAGVSEFVFRRFGAGSSGVVGEEMEGDEAAALCINFIVNSREDKDFGALGVLAPLDMLTIAPRYGRSRISYRFQNISCFVSWCFEGQIIALACY